MLVGACGGDDDDAENAEPTPAASTPSGNASEDETNTPATAEDPEAVADAHAALIVLEDLPGEGWIVVSEDEFDDDLAIGDDEVEACQALSEATEAGQEDLDAARLGRAQRSLSQTNPDLLVPVSVEVEVNLFANEEVPAQRFVLFQEVLSSDDFVECLEQATVQNLGEDEGEISVERVDPKTDPPSDGEGFAAVVTASLPFEEGGEGETLEFSLHVEGYVWQYQNAGVTVFISGSEDAVTTELVETAVGTVQERLETALAN